MTRKPVNPRPWHCIACGAELPPERQQGRCLECLIGPGHSRSMGQIACEPVVWRMGKRP